MRTGLHTGIRSGINPGDGGGVVVVPTDGPDGVYRPTTAGHFAALSIPAPTALYACQEASGDLAPAIGSGDLAASGSGHLYQQTVTGWSVKFVGLTDGVSGEWTRTLSLSAGESCIVLAYLAHEATGARYLVPVTGAANRFITLGASGGVRTYHGSAFAAGSADHSGLATVRPYQWIRNATDDVSGLRTDLESIAGTHDESATSGNFGLGSSAGADLRCCLLAAWTGADADALIAAGYGNEALLTALGWSLAYP